MVERHLELVFFDAGGGHRAAMEALVEVLAQLYPDWKITVTNLQETLESADPLFILTGKKSQDFYNAALKMGMTYGSHAFLRGLQGAISLYAPRMEKVLREQHWHADADGRRIDAVVSMIPNFDGVMYRALQAARPGTPFVTVMTDMADQPKHFWQEKQDQYMICGTPYAAAQARNRGWYRPECVFETSGMILRPSFYDQPKKPRLSRAELGLSDDLPTALIMFGGYGSSTAGDIVERFAKARLEVQSIVMCGRNEELRLALQNAPNCHAVGFTREVADYMRLADFFIGKPGPGSMSEAWHMGLPVVVENNFRTMIQERPNVTLAEAMGLGIGVNGFRTIARRVQELIASGELERMRANVRRLNNRAVYEIPEILDEIMKRPPLAPRPKGLTPPRKLQRLARKLTQELNDSLLRCRESDMLRRIKYQERPPFVRDRTARDRDPTRHRFPDKTLPAATTLSR